MIGAYYIVRSTSQGEERDACLTFRVPPVHTRFSQFYLPFQNQARYVFLGKNYNAKLFVFKLAKHGQNGSS